MQDIRCKDPHAWDDRVSRRTYPNEAKPWGWDFICPWESSLPSCCPQPQGP